MGKSVAEKIEIKNSRHFQPAQDIIDRILTQEAIDFLTGLHTTFEQRRHELLHKRKERQNSLDRGDDPALLSSTASIRSNPSWRVAKAPADLTKRWVEITGPTDKKMMINAFNSGANIYMADFEDANSPTWKNLIEGQSNLIDAVRENLSFTSPEGKEYKLKSPHAVLMVRPRGWHLEENHLMINGKPISGSLFDFGLAFFHNAKALLKKGSGPYYYLPKLESHLEARLWNDVFVYSQKQLNIPNGCIRATVLIETILAALEMEEILYELKDHSAGLNAGRWDYLFSIIKKLGMRGDALFPDRSSLTMETPFMRAYARLLVQTCHSRGAFAIGGMSAFIPSRKDPVINETALKKVTEDKLREVNDGFDGTWVAHPDLVPIARKVFEEVLEGRPNQLENRGPVEHIGAKNLLDFRIPGTQITEEGMRQNIGIALQYLASWLSGTGAAAIANLMEDAATAEISRSQLWQWLHHPGARLANSATITMELYKKLANEELIRLEKQTKAPSMQVHLQEAKKILDNLVASDNCPDFLTLAAKHYLD